YTLFKYMMVLKSGFLHVISFIRYYNMSYVSGIEGFYEARLLARMMPSAMLAPIRISRSTASCLNDAKRYARANQDFTKHGFLPELLPRLWLRQSVFQGARLLA